MEALLNCRQVPTFREALGDWRDHCGCTGVNEGNLTGMRLTGGDRLQPIPYEDCLARRRAVPDKLREAANAGDEAAQLVLKKWDPDYAGVWRDAPASEQ